MGEAGLPRTSAGAGAAAEKTDATGAPETMKEAAADAAPPVLALQVIGRRLGETLRVSLGSITFLPLMTAQGLLAAGGLRLFCPSVACSPALPMQCKTRSTTRARSAVGACLTSGATPGSGTPLCRLELKTCSGVPATGTRNSSQSGEALLEALGTWTSTRLCGGASCMTQRQQGI